MDSVTEGKKSNRHLVVVLVLVGFIAATTVGIAGAWVLTAARKNDLRSAIEHVAEQHKVSQPLLYPTHLPHGFSLVDGSVVAIREGINFVVSDVNTKLFVTEQPRPKLMEEVTKTQEFNTAAGQAYIANLNGRLAGFLVTSETLVIATPSSTIDTDILKQFLEALAPL
jgi:flagellar basal body-associated protein FliL